MPPPSTNCPYCQDAAEPGHPACPRCLAYYADFFDSSLYRRLHPGKAPEALAHHEAWLAARDGVIVAQPSSPDVPLESTPCPPPPTPTA